MDWDSLEADWGDVRLRFKPIASRPLGETSGLQANSVSHTLVAILHQNRFLLTHIAGRGYCIPSGHVEPGETLEEAAQREAYEEAGAHIRNLRLIGHYQLRPAGIEPPKSEFISYASLYLAELASLGPLPPDSESQGVRWATLETLSDLYHQWSPLMEAVFNYVLEKADENR